MQENKYQLLQTFFKDNNPKKLTILSILGIFVFIFFYHIFYFNKFLPPNDGWFYLLAEKINSGQIPHRDFYFCLPAGYLYLINFVNKLFGNSFINMRIYGIIERFFICSLLLLSFKKFIRMDYLLISIFAAFVCMSSMTYDLISSPAQTSILCSVIVLYLWNLFFEQTQHAKSNFILFFIGFFSAFSGFFKQNTGILVCFASFVICLLFLCKNIKQKIIDILFLFLGMLLPILFVLVFLIYNSSFSAFVSQLFSNAISTKGGIFEMLLGIITHNFTSASIESILLIALFLGYIKLIEPKTKYMWEDQRAVTENIGSILLTICTSVLSVFMANILVHQNYIRITVEKTYNCFLTNMTCICFVTIVFLGLRTLYTLFYKKDTKQNNYVLLAFVGVGFAQMIASGLSVFFDPNTMIIAVVIFYVALFNIKIPYVQYKNILVYVLLCFIIFVSTFYKYKIPYRWWGWTSYSIDKSIIKINDIPILKGFVLSDVETDVVQKIYKLSKENLLGKDDYIYAFPNAPLVHVISGRNPDLITVFPQIDVYPDYMALKDSEYIKMNPPKIIFYIKQEYYYWAIHRKFFRGGRISAQEKTNIDILKLIKNKDLNYREVPINYPIIIKNNKEIESSEIKSINKELEKLSGGEVKLIPNKDEEKILDKQNLHIYVKS